MIESVMTVQKYVLQVKYLQQCFGIFLNDFFGNSFAKNTGYIYFGHYSLFPLKRE